MNAHKAEKITQIIRIYYRDMGFVCGIMRFVYLLKPR